MEATLLVELLTEELPPRSLVRLAEAFRDLLVADLKQRGFLAANSAARALATPRRLTVMISHVRDVAPDCEVLVKGPAVKSGLDASGKPTPALLGFARKRGVPVERLVRISDGKQDVFAHRDLAKGGLLETTLDLSVATALEELPIPKVMRWGDGDAEFARPAHGLVMLHGSRVVPGEVLGLGSSNHTLGHRFMGGGPITLKHADDYERALRDEGKVIASLDVRRSQVVENLEKAAGNGVELVANDALFDEITALVEAPTVYEGKFSSEFLEVPQECLILSMQQHQKYVPLRDKTAGVLLPRFLFVSNLQAGDPSHIIRGNERVLRARLADARFFYDQDRRLRLEERVPQLANVVYHNRLGSQLQRVERIQLLAGRIARELGADALLAERAAWLSKADLLTGMVGEFPELQGIMGRYYALNDGEPKEVADAIEAHYRPRFAGDALPAGKVACAVALADKLEALAGFFGISQQPGGDKDPFALRRAALGVTRILAERSYPLSLNELVSAAFSSYATSVEDASADLESFILDRFAGYLKDRGYSTLEVDAVLSLRPMRLDLVPRQLEAVRAFLALPESESLAAANKRIRNILQKSPPPSSDLFSETKLVENEERQLYHAYIRVDGEADRKLKQGEFTGALTALAALKEPVDAFFDHVMVNVDDAGLRNNRLLLLMHLESAMNRVADISKLAV